MESGNKELVAISDELKFIENYIAMERDRVGQRCKIDYNVSDSVDSVGNYKVPPLILITLVENAFKQSVTITREWFVHIIMVVKVSNSLPGEQLSNPSTGIGLLNIRERLKMLFAGCHKLELWQMKKALMSFSN